MNTCKWGEAGCRREWIKQLKVGDSVAVVFSGDDRIHFTKLGTINQGAVNPQARRVEFVYLGRHEWTLIDENGKGWFSTWGFSCYISIDPLTQESMDDIAESKLNHLFIGLDWHKLTYHQKTVIGNAIRANVDVSELESGF